MGESKQANFRIDPATADKFRAFCEENGMSQAQGFEHIMQIIEINQAKLAIPGRATEIEDFERTLKEITGMYLRSVEICSAAEARAKEQFASAIERQNRTIDDLQEKIQRLQDELDLSSSNIEEAMNAKERAEKDLLAAEKMKDAAEKTATDKQMIADTLASKLSEAETKAREYDNLMLEYKKLKELNRDPEQRIKELQKDFEYAVKDEKQKMEKELADRNAEYTANKQLEIDNLKEQLRAAKNAEAAAKKDAENAKMLAIAELSDEYRADIAVMQARINDLTDQLMDALKNGANSNDRPPF